MITLQHHHVCIPHCAVYTVICCTLQLNSCRLLKEVCNSTVVSTFRSYVGECIRTHEQEQTRDPRIRHADARESVS